MKKMNFRIGGLIMMLTAFFALNSCKKTFDAPPGPQDPALTVTHTIRQLKALHTVSGAYDVITQDMIISGVVIANDKSGNLYKEIYIQDSTGAINIKLDANGLYNTFPVGRRVFVKAKGLCISDYNRLPQLGIRAVVAGSPSLEAITNNLISQYIIGGSLNNPVTPKVVTVAQLTTNMSDDNLGTLIQLNDYEFVTSDTSKTYADTSSYKNSVNLTVRGCAANSSIIIRSSGYSNFAGVNVPNGNGRLLAIYTVFGNTRQLIIRDTSDVQFNSFRCGQGPTTVINTADLRALYTGTTTAAPAGRRITGVVISDRSTSNLNGQNLVLQQGNGLAGIVVRFDATHSFNLGDSIDVNVSQQELSEFNGLLQVNQVPLGFATRISTGRSITPRVVTLADVNANFEAWESTLVRTGAVGLSGGSAGTYSGSVTLNDGATLVMFTSSSAAFAGQTYPSNASSVTGYLSQFGAARQIGIRSAADVIAAAPPPPPPPSGDLIISEYVEGTSNNKYIEIYNAGSTVADLSKYTVRLYVNGQTTVTSSQVLSALTSGPATLAPGATLVLRNTSAALTLPAGVTAYASGVCNFNGDDVVELEKEGVVIDLFGLKGTDPGTSWTIAGNANAAVDKSVRRKSTITAGNTNWATSAGTSAADSEWEVSAAADDVSNLGSR